MDFTQAIDGTKLSHYRLYLHNSPVTADVLRFHGREALSEPFCWNIEFTTLQDNISPQHVLLKYASLIMRSGKKIHGIITGFDWLATTADQSHYRVRLESRLALLACSRRCALYQNLSVPELVEQLLRRHGLEGAELDFRLERQYPSRELITQWRETDLQFIRRILSEVGIWFRSEINATTEQETLIFADSAVNYHFDISLPYREASGFYRGAEECCWRIRSWHQAVTGNLTSPNDHAPALADRDTVPESDAFYARIADERALNRSSVVHLFSNACGLMPGQVLELQGNSTAALQQGMVIALTTFRASRDSGLQVSVWGMPYTERFCFRPPEILRPQISGTLSGRVDSRNPDQPCAWLDRQGRYRIRLDFDRDGDCEPGYCYSWLRLAKPVAGDSCGWHMPLTPGTEVAIVFQRGDPDLPYIAYAFHDSEHPDIVNRDNRSQNILRTAGANELRMEDKRGEQHIALSTEFGSSQLNQGYITNTAGTARGCGFELRTDEQGVIRVAKGLFISADGQQKAAGEVLDRESALQEIDICLQQLRQLNLAAEQAQALQADIASQLTLFQPRLKALNGMIHFSAPQGMAFSSGEHLQLATAENMALNAGGDISIGAMENITMLADENIGLFAQNGTLSLISAKAPVEIKAQHGNIHLSAAQKLSMVALADVLITGKKRITLIGGGSYLTLNQGQIEYGTTGSYLAKGMRTAVCGPAAMPLDLPASGAGPKYSVAVISGKDNDQSEAPVFKLIPEEKE